MTEQQAFKTNIDDVPLVRGLEMGVGDVLFTPKNRWHGFRNTSETEDVVLIWCWAGASSRDTAGYEVRAEQH